MALVVLPDEQAPARVARRRGRLPNVALPLLFGLAGVAVAAAGSWIPSLWGDEAASLLSAERPLGSLFAMLGHLDAVHGAYYLGLHVWIDVFGPSPFSIRFPSALAAGATVAGTVVIAQRLANGRVALLAGIVCVVLPRTTYMGAEARSFGLSAAIATWLTVVLLELVHRRGRTRPLWVVYGALLALGTYVFLYVALFVAVHALVLLAARPGRRVLVPWAVAVCAAGVATLPLAYWAGRESHQVDWLSNAPITPGTLLVQVFFGNAVAAVVGWTLVAVGIAVSALLWRRGSAGSRPLLGVTAAATAFVPAILLFAASVVTPDFTERYLSFSAPGIALLMASGLAFVLGRRPVLLAVATTLAVATVAPSYVQQRGPYADNQSDWAEISAVMGRVAHPGDAVAFDDSARPSRRPRLAMRAYPAGFAGLRDVTLETPFTRSPSWHDDDYRISKAASLGRFDGVQRLWLIEYSNGTKVDDSGMSTLLPLGFTIAAQYPTHRSVVYELVRTGP